MTLYVHRVGQVFGLGPRWAWAIVVVGFFGLTAMVAMATRLGMLTTVLGLVVIAIVVVASLRWPLLPLFAFVALIPIEEVVDIGGFGTLSKFAGILFAVCYGIPRLPRLSFRAMPAAGWAYLAWAIVSLGWALSPDTASVQLVTLVQLFLIAVLVADVVVQRPSLVRPLLWAYSVSAVVTAVVGIMSFVILGPVAQARASAVEGQDPAQFAAVLLPAVIFGLYEVLSGERRLLGGAIAVLTSAGVVVSGTRGAWVSVVVVVVVFILPRLSLRRQVSAIAVIMLIALATLQIPGVSGLLAERTGNAVSTGGAGRTDIWTVGIAIYQSAPVLGVGYANFPVANTQDAARASAVSLGFAGSGPHNLVIGTMVELGPIGLAILLLFLLPLVLRRGWGPDAATVQAALTSLVIAALFVDILSNRKQVWLFIGLAAGLAYVRRKRSVADEADEPMPSLAGPEPTHDRGLGVGVFDAGGTPLRRP